MASPRLGKTLLALGLAAGISSSARAEQTAPPPGLPATAAPPAAGKPTPVVPSAAGQPVTVEPPPAGAAPSVPPPAAQPPPSAPPTEARPAAIDGKITVVTPAEGSVPQSTGDLLLPLPVAPLSPVTAPTTAPTVAGAPLALEPPLVRASAPDIGGLPLARLLDLEPNWTGLGSFKLRLPRYGITSYIHGITELLFAAQSQDDPAYVPTDNNPATIDNPGLRPTLSGRPASFAGNFDLFVGADLRNVLFTELELILTSDGGNVDVNFAQIDLRVFRDFLVVRGGKFLVPFGGMNTYPDPFFVFKLPELPLYYSHIVPQRWGELGLQLYGRYSWGENRALSYAFYVVNGLEQKGGFGGDIGLMKDNLRDSYDGDKAVGGQVQIEPVPGFSMGVSAYTGVYTQTDSHRLTMGDFHLGLQYKKLTLRGEFAAALQETATDPLHKYGAYLLASYRAIAYLEPVVMADYVNLDSGPLSDRYTGTLGLICYPYPQKAASGAIRTAYSFSWDGNGNFAGHRFAAMLVIGF